MTAVLAACCPCSSTIAKPVFLPFSTPRMMLDLERANSLKNDCTCCFVADQGKPFSLTQFEKLLSVKYESQFMFFGSNYWKFLKSSGWSSSSEGHLPLISFLYFCSIARSAFSLDSNMTAACPFLLPFWSYLNLILTGPYSLKNVLIWVSVAPVGNPFTCKAFFVFSSFDDSWVSCGTLLI